MGALGDVMDHWNTFPTPVKILVVGGVGVAGYLGYRHFAAGGGGAAGTASTPMTLDLAPQGTTDTLSANGGANGATGTTGAGAGAPPAASGPGATGTPKPPVKKPPVKKPPVKTPTGAHTGAHPATVAHLRKTAQTTRHPNLRYGTRTEPVHKAHEPHVMGVRGGGSATRPSL